MSYLDILLDALVVGVAIAGAVTDLLYQKIFNWLTLPALLLGFALQTIGYGLGDLFGQGLLAALFGAAFCAVVFGIFHFWGKGFGAGDVKLLAAIGALAGFSHALTCAMCTAIIGALLAFLRILFGPNVSAAFRGLFRVRQTPDSPRATVPYGLAIALGVIWATLMRYKVFSLL
jgi:prepilin peptidase CpaA